MDGDPSVAEQPVDSSLEPIPRPLVARDGNDDVEAALFRELRLAVADMASAVDRMCIAVEELHQSSLDLRTSCRRLLARVVRETRNRKPIGAR